MRKKTSDNKKKILIHQRFLINFIKTAALQGYRLNMSDINRNTKGRRPVGSTFSLLAASP